MSLFTSHSNLIRSSRRMPWRERERARQEAGREKSETNRRNKMRARSVSPSPFSRCLPTFVRSLFPFLYTFSVFITLIPSPSPAKRFGHPLASYSSASAAVSASSAFFVSIFSLSPFLLFFVRLFSSTERGEGNREDDYTMLLATIIQP